MLFTQTKIPGVYIVDIEPQQDERGFFARTWAVDEFQSRGLNIHVVQCSVSFNAKRGTLRGIHYQAAPFEEAKLVRCTQGALYDVALDLRPDSPAYKAWVAVTLTAENRRMVFISEGVAHGFLTLADETEVFYQISEVYDPASTRGVRWNDPAFQIDWPESPRVISARDQQFPDFPQ